MDYSVYVLISEKNTRRYTGLTKKHPSVRLAEHNSGTSKSTKRHRPYTQLYFEKGYCRQCARQREKFLKSGQGRKILDCLINNERDRNKSAKME